MLTTGLRCAPPTFPMKRIAAITKSPGAVTAAAREIGTPVTVLTTSAPTATSTRRNVPSTSEKSRRISFPGSLKSRTHGGVFPPPWPPHNTAGSELGWTGSASVTSAEYERRGFALPGQRGASALEKGLLGAIGGECQRRVICLTCLEVAAKPAEQVRPDRMEEVVAVEVKALDGTQRGCRALHLGKRNGAVERNDGGGGDRHELVVELEDLAPIRGTRRDPVAVHRVDRRLNLKRTWPITTQAFAHQRLALVDELPIPERAVLVGEQDEVAARRGTGSRTRLDEEHQRQQSDHLGFVGQQLCQQPHEPDRLRTQCASREGRARACGVPLVEDQVHHGEDRAQPFGKLGFARDAVGNAGVANLALGAHQPLGHRRLGDQERARDLRGGED